MPGETSGEVMLLRRKPLRSTVNDPPSSEENSFFVPERGPVLRSWLSQEEDRKQDSGSDSEMIALGYLENIASRHA
jgi:hypothetical protein